MSGADALWLLSLAESAQSRLRQLRDLRLNAVLPSPAEGVPDLDVAWLFVGLGA
jgi:hypothetical protein